MRSCGESATGAATSCVTVISAGHDHRGAVLVQHGDLVAHGVGIAEQVAGVGVVRDEPQREPLPRAADEDRDALLQRPRVAEPRDEIVRPANAARPCPTGAAAVRARPPGARSARRAAGSAQP